MTAKDPKPAKKPTARRRPSPAKTKASAVKAPAKAVQPATSERSKPAEPRVPTPPPLPLPEPRNRLWWYVSAFALAVVLGLGSAYLAHKRTVGHYEMSVFRHINDWPNRLRGLFLALTIVPESLWLGVAAVAAAFFAKLYRLSWRLAVATVGGYAIAEIGKKFIGRGRPLDVLSDAHVRAHETGMGYPSGHTMIMTVIMLSIFPYLPKGWRWLVLVPIATMALSRVYLGVHFPLDVVGGFAVGLAVVAGMRLVPGPILRFFRLD